MILSNKTSAQNFHQKEWTMKKLTTVIMVLSLVLGGVALAAAADLPQVSKNLDLSAMQKISDQEAKQIKGTGMSFGPQFGGFSGLGNPACPQSQTGVCIPIQDQTRLQTRISR
jgi:glycerol kinase